MIRIRLKKGAEKLPQRHHPWVFSGAIDRIDCDDDTGIQKSGTGNLQGMCSVHTLKGEFIAYGWLQSSLNISIRLLSWEKQVIPDTDWWMNTIQDAIQKRKQLMHDGVLKTDCCRLIHGEADYLPGLIVDAYNHTLHVMISARVAYEHRNIIIETLRSCTPFESIMVSTDESMRVHESLPEIHEIVHGKALDTVIMEQGIAYYCDIAQGQKSGFYFDQRDNRIAIEPFVKGSDVLDAFCYTGGFSLHAMRAGARSVLAMDSSDPALRLLEKNLALNIDLGIVEASVQERLTVQKANVFDAIRSFEKDRFSFMVLDPPKLASSKSKVAKAERAYKDLNRVAIERIRRGGCIATFTCSGNISREHFRKILAWAAHDAGRDVQIISTLGQPQDHPIRMSFPESEYLKGYIIRVI